MSMAVPVLTRDNILNILATTRDADAIKHCRVALREIPATFDRLEEAYSALYEIAVSCHRDAITNLNQEEVIRQMHDDKRDDLVHYAGALHRDHHAWLVTREWILDRTASESALLQRVAGPVR